MKFKLLFRLELKKILRVCQLLMRMLAKAKLLEVDLLVMEVTACIGLLMMMISKLAQEMLLS